MYIGSDDPLRQPIAVNARRGRKGLLGTAAIVAGSMMSAALLPTAALAQEGAEEAIEEVVVTGSRIRNANLSSPSPVTTIGADEIDARGIVRIEDILVSLPQTFTSAGNGNFGGAGTATVNLRGLGQNRTLVLFNGRRLPFGQSNQVAPDLNQIPSQLIERVEVLTGGASAVYGADAVAGVVNFITKRDFEGVDFDIQFGAAQTGNNSSRFEAILEEGNQPVPGSTVDGFEYSASLTLGANTADGRGNVTGYFTYRDINEIRQSERIGSACAFGGGDPEFFCLGSSTTSPARITDFGLADVNFDLLAFDPNTLETRDFVAGGIPNDTFNFASTQRNQAPAEQFTFGALSRYELTDNVEVYLDFAFSQNVQQGQIGPSGAFFVTDTLNCDNPLFSPEQLDAICTQNGLGGSDLATAFVGRRNVEGGPRQFNFENTTFRVLLGLRGDINEAWNYDVSGQFSRVTNVRGVANDLLQDRIQQSLLIVTDPVTGEPVCSDPSNGCVPYDIFSPAGPSQEALDFISLPSFESGEVRQEIITATLGGDLGEYGFALPWAETGVQLVTGFEYRRDELTRNADQNLAEGNIAGAGGATLPVAGSIDVWELFAEVAVPIVEGRPGAEELSFTGAYRYSDFSTTGGQNTWALGLSWTPIEDLRLRGQFQRATRSPNIFELFLGQNTGLFDLSDPDGDGIFDPCAGAVPSATFEQCANTGVTADQFGNVPDNPAGQFNNVTGGNPNLEEEVSDTFTVGAIFTPSFLPGLTLSVDYFDIEVEDFIGTVPEVLALNNCLETGDEFFCSLIQRDGGGSLFVDGTTSFIVATNINTGSLSTSGIDFDANYNFEIGDYGSVNVDYNSSYLIDFVEVSLPGEDPFDCAGLFGGTCNGQIPRPEYNHRLRASWASPYNFDLSVTWRRVGGFGLQGAAPDNNNLSNDISDVNFWDLSVNLAVFGSVQTRIGINNIFDRRPAIFSGGPAGLFTGNTFPGLYDTAGRFGFIGFNVTL